MSGKITSVGAAAVGGRVKYLVDTPEMIWGCLDLKDYQAAAQRFLGCDACFHTGRTRPVVFASRQRANTRSLGAVWHFENAIHCTDEVA